MVSKQIIEDTVIGACVAFLNHDTIEHIADSIYRACQDDSNIASIKKLNVRLVEIEQAIENLWNALELGDAAERITKRINAREEEKTEIERQLAIERRKIKSFDYPRIHAFLEQMKGLNCANLSDCSKLSTMFIHTIFYYDDYLIIIMNGEKGLVTAENIPLKSIDNSFTKKKSHLYGWLFFLVIPGNRTRLNATPRWNVAVTSSKAGSLFNLLDSLSSTFLSS